MGVRQVTRAKEDFLCFEILAFVTSCDNRCYICTSTQSPIKVVFSIGRTVETKGVVTQSNRFYLFILRQNEPRGLTKQHVFLRVTHVKNAPAIQLSGKFVKITGATS